MFPSLDSGGVLSKNSGCSIAVTSDFLGSYPITFLSLNFLICKMAKNKILPYEKGSVMVEVIHVK